MIRLIKNKTVFKALALTLAALTAAAVFTGCSGKTPAAASPAQASEELSPEADTESSAEAAVPAVETADAPVINSAANEGSETHVIDDSKPEGPAEASDIIKLVGKVTEINEESVVIDSSEYSSDYPMVELIVNDSTLIYSVEKGVLKFADLQKDDEIYAWTSMSMTRSIPPQSVSEAILTDVTSADSMSVYCRVTGVEIDDYKNINLITDQELILIPNEDTVITRLDKTQVSAAEITENSRLIVRYNMMTMSIPAITNPLEILVVG